MNVIETAGLGKRYGRTWALTDAALAIPAGYVVALVGPNGAGKTMLLHMSVGLTRPVTGQITVLGSEPAGSPAALDQIAFVAQDAPLYKNLSTAGMLHLTRNLNRRWDQQRAEARLKELSIPLDRKVGKLSGGQQAQLALTLLSRGQVQVAGEVEGLLAGHSMLTGPAPAGDDLAERLSVVHTRRAGPRRTCWSGPTGRRSRRRPGQHPWLRQRLVVGPVVHRPERHDGDPADDPQRGGARAWCALRYTGPGSSRRLSWPGRRFALWHMTRATAPERPGRPRIRAGNGWNTAGGFWAPSGRVPALATMWGRPAGAAMRGGSGRYDGHVLRSRQLFGLTRRRGWHGGFLSDAYDGGGTTTAHRDYPAAGLRVSWWLETPEPDRPGPHIELCQTGRLIFTASGDAAMTPIPLADVPPELFSEAMRDLDLFVSVTTVASDPTWPEGWQAPAFLAGYWDRAGRGGLDQLRASRRQALAPMYATPGPGDRFQLTERDLVVHGSLAIYHIDLATAGVRMEPAGKWLSFDTRQAAPASTTDLFPWLPVTDDHEILSRITFRATTLANEEQLASRRLLRQIRHR